MSQRMDPVADMNSRGRPVPVDRPDRQRDPRPRTVLVVLVVFKYPKDKARDDLLRINRAMSGMARSTAQHADHQVCWIIQTSMTAEQLMAKLGPTLDTTSSVFNAWVFTPGADAACMLPLDPFTDRIAEAWRNVRRYNASRSTHRNLPRVFFEIDREVFEDGRRGVATTAILDDHPLDRRGE